MQMDALKETQRLDLGLQDLNRLSPKTQDCSERQSPSPKCSSSDRLTDILPFLNESSCVVRNEEIGSVSDQALRNGWETGSSRYSYWQMGCLGGGEAPAQNAAALMTTSMLTCNSLSQPKPSPGDEDELRLLRYESSQEANSYFIDQTEGSAYLSAFSSEQQASNVEASMLDLASKLEAAPNAYADPGLPPLYAAKLNSDSASEAIIDPDELLLRRQLLRSQIFNPDRPYLEHTATPDLLCFGPHTINGSLPSFYEFEGGLELASSVAASLQNLHNFQEINSYNFLQLPSEAVFDASANAWSGTPMLSCNWKVDSLDTDFQEAEASVPLSDHNTTGWLTFNTAAISSETNICERSCLTENIKDKASTMKRLSHDALGETTDANKRHHLETGTQSRRSSVWASPAISNIDTTVKQGANITPQSKSSSSSSAFDTCNLKPRAKQGCATDPQSTAARNRRERISKRLKILQDLVPNGSKVDLVTMLEKAISYVKFLQLQVHVLRADEYWPNQDQQVKSSNSHETTETTLKIVTNDNQENNSGQAKKLSV